MMAEDSNLMLNLLIMILGAFLFGAGFYLFFFTGAINGMPSFGNPRDALRVPVSAAVFMLFSGAMLMMIFISKLALDTQFAPYYVSADMRRYAAVFSSLLFSMVILEAALSSGTKFQVAFLDLVGICAFLFALLLVIIATLFGLNENAPSPPN